MARPTTRPRTGTLTTVEMTISAIRSAASSSTNMTGSRTQADTGFLVICSMPQRYCRRRPAIVTARGSIRCPPRELHADQAGPVGQHHDLHPVPQVQLGQDAGHVGLHRLPADHQLL